MICRPERDSAFEERGALRRVFGRILVVDPVLGSRFALAQAAAQPGFDVETAHGIEGALRCLADGPVALVLSELELGASDQDGLALLTQLRETYPDSARALVTARGSIEFTRRAIAQADLSFVLRKPWNPAALRRTISEVLDGRIGGAGWNTVEPGRPLPREETSAMRSAREEDRRHEILLRGLLAGLNSCEFETQLFELLHTELADPFGVSGWLWVDEERGLATRIADDRPVESEIALSGLSFEEAHAVELARLSSRVTRLDDGWSTPGASEATIRLSFAIQNGSRRTLTCVVWLERSESTRVVSLLRDLHGGLQNAFRRIRDAEARARAARRLARRVSEELRTPVGALTHAIDRLRGEAERAGMSAEWMDRVSSESQRVMEAVEHLEGEIFPEPASLASTSS